MQNGRRPSSSCADQCGGDRDDEAAGEHDRALAHHPGQPERRDPHALRTDGVLSLRRAHSLLYGETTSGQCGMTGGPRTDLEAEGVLDAALALLAQLRERGLQVDEQHGEEEEGVHELPEVDDPVRLGVRVLLEVQTERDGQLDDRLRLSGPETAILGC